MDPKDKERINEDLRYFKDYKKILVEEINEINDMLKGDLISKKEYNDFFSKRINGKTRSEWIDFCNKYIIEKGKAVDKHKKEVRGRIYHNVKPLLHISAILILLFVFSLLMPSMPIGLVSMDKEFNYTDNVNLVVDSDFEYTWLMGNYGSLKSVRLDGSVGKEGSAKVYLEHDGNRYLVFDSLRLGEEGIGEVIGLVVGDEVNESTDNSSIIITVQGGGSEGMDDVFEFDVKSSFDWDVSYGKLCTKWDVNLVSVCYGSSDCCALIELESLGKWNDTFYLSYGRYDSGLSNVVRAQVIYANYSLDAEEPYSDIVYSDVEELRAEFYEEVISFKDVCVETCLLPSLNATSYILRFVVSNASLRVDDVRYSIERSVNISRNAPLLANEIGNITVYKNEDIVINLSEYFYDEDGDSLAYTAYEAEDISVVINDSIARLVSDYNFTGKRYMFFKASDGYYNVSSNVFYINVIEKPLQPEEVNVSSMLIKPSVVINRPVRWVKKVNVSDSVINLTVNISSDALNVSVRDVKEDRVVDIDNIKIKDKGVVKNYSVYRAEKRILQIKKIKDKFGSEKLRIIMEDPTAVEKISSINEKLLELENERNRLTGYVVAYEGEGLLTKFFEWLFNVEITGYAVADVSNESSDITSVIIGDIIEEVEIEYYTEGPISKEENITAGKRIVVSSDIHYEDILAYTYLDGVSQNKIRLYHVVNKSRKLVNNVGYYDENNNGLIDYIEWVVPSLSNETYEVIIEIIKAEHLDSNRSFIADVYDSVKDLDDKWSPAISSGEYVRVTFEVPLDNTKDITVYARVNGSVAINGTEVPYDIYEKKKRIEEINEMLR